MPCLSQSTLSLACSWWWCCLLHSIWRPPHSELHPAQAHTLTDKPAFYVSATSKTDPSVAPPGHEAVFVLVPISYELKEKDTAEMRAQLLEHILARMEV